MIMKTFQLQFKQMLRSWEFQLSFLLMTVFSVGSFYVAVKDASGQTSDYLYDAEWYFCTNYSINWIFWGGLFFIVTVMPFSTSYIKEVKNGNLIPILMRSNRSDYFISKLFVTAAGNAMVTGIPLLLNYVLCWFWFPHNEHSMYWVSRVYRDEFLMGESLLYQTDYPHILFGDLYVNNRWLFHLWMLLLTIVFAAAIGCLALCLSFLIRKGRLLLFLPCFLIWQILSSVDSVMYERAMEDPNIKYFNYNVFSYLQPFGSLSGMSFVYFLVFLAIIAVICAVLLIYIIRSEEKILAGE